MPTPLITAATTAATAVLSMPPSTATYRYRGRLGPLGRTRPRGHPRAEGAWLLRPMAPRDVHYQRYSGGAFGQPDPMTRSASSRTYRPSASAEARPLAGRANPGHHRLPGARRMPE